MNTTDYKKEKIADGELEDLKSIADVNLTDLSADRFPDLLVFPDSLDAYDPDLGRKFICSVTDGDTHLVTNSMVGFVGRNTTRLSIRSRFAAADKEDFFLHYMLRRICGINLFNLEHSTTSDQVFDFLLYMFPRFLNKAVRQGLFKCYVNHRHNSPRVRGSIDIARHIRLNTPFNGNIAHASRDFTADNHLTQLIRHTIEHISMTPVGSFILTASDDTRRSVELIRQATPTYSSSLRLQIINRNIRPFSHPYFHDYAPLQRICLQILRHDHLKYGCEKDNIFGLLIDAAWLWEEYLATVLQNDFTHYIKDSGPRFHLFKPGKQQIIPDYLSKDGSVVADAKYIPLDKESSYSEDSEKATSIFYKTVTYMYRFSSRKAYLFYPSANSASVPTRYLIDSMFGGEIVKLSLVVPANCKSFTQFSELMAASEAEFLNHLK